MKITQKIENSISTLEKSIRRTEAWNKAMEIAYSTLTQLNEMHPKTISQLRALEANAAAAYFRAWKCVPIKWRGISKRPIPETWQQIGQRTSIFHLAGNRNASHPVNAILNYAYTVLQSEIQINAITDGYDPGHVFRPADFIMRSDGVCRLNLEMAIVRRRFASGD